MKRYDITLCGKHYDAWFEQLRFYANGRTALVLVDESGPIATATVNLPDVELADGEVFIKDWSENKGMLAELVRHGIVEDTGKRIPTGYVEAAVCKLKVQP